MTGIGTINDPWDLATAINSTEIQNSYALNRIINLNSGTPHAGDYVCTLQGNATRKITIQPVTTAKINGDVYIAGGHLILKNLEIYWDGWATRHSEMGGSAPTDITLKNLRGYGSPVKFINCIIHDLSSPYFEEGALGWEFYGCVIYHIGFSGSDRGHGHGLYLHNISATKTVKDCIIFDNFGWGIHAYSPNGGTELKNFVFEGNTCFNAGSLYGVSYRNFLLGGDLAGGQADNSSFIANMSYGAGGLQFYGAGAINVTLTDNYMPDGKVGTYTAVSESGNNWDTVGNQIFVRPNEYQTDRANVTIYNEAESNTVSVDLSAVTGLVVGDSVTVRNVQDYFVDIQTLTLDADKKITINMQAVNRTVATPVQWTAPATTFPKFGCFVIEKA